MARNFRLSDFCESDPPIKTGDKVDVYGYEVVWGKKHLLPSRLKYLKNSYDKLAHDSLVQLEEWESDDKFLDYYDRLQRYAQTNKIVKSDSPVHQLLDQLNTVPEWVDWDQIRRGQDVFYRFAGAMLTGLLYQSLIGGFGAFRISATLVKTGAFNVEHARRRLYQTTQHILQVTDSPEALMPGGEGWKSTIRVRMLHCSVRANILRLAHEDETYYSVSEFGIPINDADSVATIMSFCTTPLFQTLPKLGIFPSPQESLDLISMWRLVAYYIGCPDWPLASLEVARAFTESIYCSELHPPGPTCINDPCKILTHNCIAALANQPPSYASANFIAANIRYLNGSELSDALGVPEVDNYSTMMVYAQNILYYVIHKASQVFPAVDHYKISTMRLMMWKLIVDNKTTGLGKPSKFYFKHHPTLKKQTVKGQATGRHWHNIGVEKKIKTRMLLLVLTLMSVLVMVILGIHKFIISFITL